MSEELEFRKQSLLAAQKSLTEVDAEMFAEQLQNIDKALKEINEALNLVVDIESKKDE